MCLHVQVVHEYKSREKEIDQLGREVGRCAQDARGVRAQWVGVGGCDIHSGVQWNLSRKDTLNKGHLSNEDTVCSPNHTELCRNLPLK